jgi:hypothetical protein
LETLLHYAGVITFGNQKNKNGKTVAEDIARSNQVCRFLIELSVKNLRKKFSREARFNEDLNFLKVTITFTENYVLDDWLECFKYAGYEDAEDATD